MADQLENLRLSIPSPTSEDNAGAQYQQVAENRASAEALQWLRSSEAAAPAAGAKPAAAGNSGNLDVDALMNGGSQPAPAAAAAGEQSAKPAPVDEPQPMEWIRIDPNADLGKNPTSDKWIAGLNKALSNVDPKAIAKDVGKGIVDAPRQIVGGVVDALGEMDQFMQQVAPIGGVQLFNENGDFSPSLTSADQMTQQRKAEQTIFDMMAPAKDDTVTGGFVRSTAQFLTGFIPGLQMTKGMAALKGGAMLSNLAAGAIADAVVFDPNQDRLSTYLNQVPALAAIVPDYLADNNPDQSHWTGRLKNAIEGAGLGLATDGLLSAFKYYKAAATAKAAAAEAENPAGAVQQSAKDELRKAAQEELVQDVPDEALKPLGDPAGPLSTQEDLAASRSSPLDAARAVKNSDTLGPPGVQPAADKVSTLPEPSGNVETRDTDPSSITEGGNKSFIDFPLGGKIEGSNRKILQGSADYNALLHAAEEQSPILLNDLEKIVRNIPEARVSGVRAKDLAGLEAKIAQGRPAQSIGDYLGGRIVVDNRAAVEEVMKGLEGTFKILDKEDFLDNPKLGYRAVHAQVDLGNGMSAEVQIVPKDIAAVQHEAHKIYDTFKRLTSDTLTPAEVAQVAAAKAKGQALFDGNFNKKAFDTPNVRQDTKAKVSAADERAGVQGPVQPKIFINMARINSSDDVKQLLQETADRDAAFINAKRGGEVVTNEQTKKASKLELQDVGDLIGRDPGPMSAAQALAARNILASSTEKVADLAKIAQTPGATPADLYNFRRAMAVHYAIQSEVIGARTETARALQSWAIPATASKARSQAISDLIAQNGAGDIQSLAKAIAAASDNPAGINAMARELGKGRFGKALYQVWINGLLMSPKTHMANIIGNTMTAVWAIPERYMAAGMSKAFYNGEIDAGEAVSQAYGMIKGIRDGVRLVYMGNKAEGANGVGDIFDAFSKTEGQQINAISAEALGLDPAGSFGYGIDALSKLVNSPGSLLASEDKFFKSIGYRMELNALAHRTAMSEGLEGKEAGARIADILANPPENLKADALNTAAYQTFTNPLGKTGQQFQRFVQSTPGLKWIVPFIKTPTNIMKWTFARTPLAYAASSIRADISAGGARAAQAHARVAMGSMVMLSIMDMASEGTITGAGPLGPDGPSTQALRRTQAGVKGPPPYSIKIGDRWYSYSRTDPIGMVMGMGADMSSIFSNAAEADSDTVAAAGVVALASNLASKTYMSGIFDFMAAIDPNNPSANPGKYISNFATGLVPFSSFTRSLATANDPTARDSRTVVYDAGDATKIDPVATYLQTTIDGIKKGIPGLSDELPPMRDLYGEPINRGSGLGWGWDFVSPIASHVDNPDPVSKVIMDNKMQLDFPPRQIGSVKLTSQEYDQFSELSGKMVKQQLDEIVKNPGFQKLSGGPDGMKTDLIKSIIHGARDAAQGQMLLKHPDLRDRSIQIQQMNARSLTGN